MMENLQNFFKKLWKTINPVSVVQFSSVIPNFHSEFDSPSIQIGIRPEKSKPAKIRIFPELQNWISSGDANLRLCNLYVLIPYDLRILKP